MNELEIIMNYVKLLKSFSMKYEKVSEVSLWKKKYSSKRNFEISF